MADPKRILPKRPAAPQSAVPHSDGREATGRPIRPRIMDKDLRAARSALIEEAERIMGVAPILGRTGPRPGY